jgi:hypothetical protein
MIKSISSDLPAPQSYKEAISGPEASHWKIAMEEEINLLQHKHCWDLIHLTNVPSHTRPIPGRWVYAKKLKDNGSIQYKARWVIRGNLLAPSHFEQDADTYSPVVTATISHILFTAAAHYSWHILQADAVLAFLNGKLRDTVYMHQPTRFKEGEPGTLVCKLLQSLYSLSPSARIWYDTLTQRLTEIGFCVSPYDPGLYIHRSIPHLYLTTHVDDFKIVAESREIAQSILDKLKTKFEIKDLGSIRHYLSTNVCEHNSGISLS